MKDEYVKESIIWLLIDESICKKCFHIDSETVGCKIKKQKNKNPFDWDCDEKCPLLKKKLKEVVTYINTDE